MKIAIVTPTFPPYAGGIGNVAAANARSLQKLGHRVTIFTPRYRAVTEEITDIPVVRLKPIFSYGNAALVPSVVKKIFGFDIIHIHYPFFGGAEPIWLRSRAIKKRGGKIVIHYHMDVVGRGLLKSFFKFHNAIVLPSIIKAADAVIVTSLDYANQSNISRYVKQKPDIVFEVPNGVDCQLFAPGPKPAALLERHNINADERIVMFVGGLDKAHYFKGVEYLIEAMGRIKLHSQSWKLVIVGAGELQSGYADLAEQLGIGAKTIFTGYVSNNDLPLYYQLADIAVLPSVDKSEAFGLTLVEAMSCGKPVVASNLAGVRGVVSDGASGLLTEVKNADDLAAKINYLLAHPELAAEMGQAGRQKALERYDWPIIAQKLDDIYKKIRA